MEIVGVVLLVALQIFSIAMWGRFILDWVQVLAPTFRPRGVVLVIAELIFTVTDPPLNLTRRFVKPIPLGGARLDLAWVVVMISLGLLVSLVSSWMLR